jgi:hypothetical protein
LKRITQNTIDHIASLINSAAPNVKVTLNIFRSFGAKIDESDVSKGGYCGITKAQLCDKYCAILNKEQLLTDFIISYLSPAKDIWHNEILYDKIEILNNFLVFDDLKLELYDSNRKLKYVHLELPKDGSSQKSSQKSRSSANKNWVYKND